MKPIVTELKYTKEQVAKVKQIQNDKRYSQRKDKIRAVLGGPLCCICHSNIPDKKVTYDGVRIETYCTEHWYLFENTKDVSNETLAKQYGIILGDKINDR